MYHLNDLQAFTNALQVYTNYTGQTKCVNTDMNEDTSLGYLGWNFQVSNLNIFLLASDFMFFPLNISQVLHRNGDANEQ